MKKILSFVSATILATSLAACSSDSSEESTSAAATTAAEETTAATEEAASGDVTELLKSRYPLEYASALGVAEADYDSWISCSAEQGQAQLPAEDVESLTTMGSPASAEGMAQFEDIMTSCASGGGSGTEAGAGGSGLEAGLVQAATSGDYPSLGVEADQAEAWAACVLPKIEGDLTDEDKNLILIGGIPADSSPAKEPFSSASSECKEQAAGAAIEADGPSDDELQEGIHTLLNEAGAQEELDIDDAAVGEIAQCMVAPIKDEVKDVDALNKMADGSKDLPIEVSSSFTSAMTDCAIEVMTK